MSSVARRSSPPGASSRANSAAVARIDDPALVVAGLGPGIGEQDEDPLEAGIGQGLQQQAGVVDHHPHVVEPLASAIARSRATPVR